MQKQQPRLDPKRLVFIDETSVSTTITRLYGRAPQGERLVQKVPHGNWKTITFTAALRHDRVTAPFVLEGPMTGETFKAYVEQFLAPTLKRGDIVFMDNVSVHKVDGIEEALEARGAIPFYLPAYSPDLNPIEQLFAKLKAVLRKVAAYTLRNAAFTVRSLCKTIASCLDQICRAECAAYLANSGYGQPKRTMLLASTSLPGQHQPLCQEAWAPTRYTAARGEATPVSDNSSAAWKSSGESALIRASGMRTVGPAMLRMPNGSVFPTRRTGQAMELSPAAKVWSVLA